MKIVATAALGYRTWFVKLISTTDDELRSPIVRMSTNVEEAADLNERDAVATLLEVQKCYPDARVVEE